MSSVSVINHQMSVGENAELDAGRNLTIIIMAIFLSTYSFSGTCAKHFTAPNTTANDDHNWLAFTK